MVAIAGWPSPGEAVPPLRPNTCLAHSWQQGGGEIQPERIVVPVDKRCHTPILREAALDQPRQAMPWLRHLPVVFQYP
jgi:hypothetical protein